MRVFVAGATGVIGRSLVPRLIEAGHAVIAMTRNQDNVEQIVSQGAEPVVCDVYDVDGLEKAMTSARLDAVVHQLTALPKVIDPRKIEDHLAANDRVRTEGTQNLVRAAARAGVRRIIAQSLAFAYAPEGGPVKDEESPLWLDAPWPWRRSVKAIAELERQVSSIDNIDGFSLRYGNLYGNGTAFAADGAVASMVRDRQYPIVGSGAGIFSFVHVDDAASATVAALERGRPGIYNVVDDEPARQRDWLPVYAEALGAPAPQNVPSIVARPMVGEFGLHLMTEQRGASNEKARNELGWSPRFATWRSGFHAALESSSETHGHAAPSEAIAS